MNAQRTFLKGSIRNHNANGIEGVELYIDRKRIKKSTNSKGKFSIKHPTKFRLLTIYTPKYGFINWLYNGEKKIDLVFPKNSEPMEKADFMALGFSVPEVAKEHQTNFYANHGSILEILNHRFSEVRVNGNQILISRRGVNAVFIQDPLLLVNDIPTTVSTLETIPTADVKSIRVISKGSEAAVYGYRGMVRVLFENYKLKIENFNRPNIRDRKINHPTNECRRCSLYLRVNELKRMVGEYWRPRG